MLEILVVVVVIVVDDGEGDGYCGDGSCGGGNCGGGSMVDVGNLREGDARQVVQGEAWSQGRAWR